MTEKTLLKMKTSSICTALIDGIDDIVKENREFEHLTVKSKDLVCNKFHERTPSLINMTLGLNQ